VRRLLMSSKVTHVVYKSGVYEDEEQPGGSVLTAK
jgi:hypothetical protein